MNQYLPMLLTLAILAIVFVFLIYPIYRLERFRKSVNPTDLVNFKSGGSLSFKLVIARPGKDIVVLKSYDNDHSTPFRASINKIYPL